MTFRQRLTRRLYRFMAVAAAGMAALVGGLVLSEGFGVAWGRPAGMAGFVLCPLAIALLYFRGGFCPACRAPLARVLWFADFGMIQHVRNCPSCGTDLDSEEPQPTA